MAIDGYTEDEFGAKLGDALSASRPIRSIEHLKGRDKELDTIKKSLYAPGRHAFIFGDRGVGKSSLGQTAAFQYQTSDATPIFVSGSPDDTFNTVIANIVSQAIRRPRTKNIKATKSLSVEIGGVRVGEGTESGDIDIAAAIRSIGDAVEILNQIADMHSAKPVVVIDEFDAITSAEERNKFAALLKQMGDRSVNVKFIFTGIANTLDELLGAHQSAYRQLETVELPRLGWNARREIVLSAVSNFGLDIDNNVNWRIAMISDGYPYYVHSIMEKILWAAFSAEDTVTEIGWELFSTGLADAIQSINAELKKPYEKAVLHRDPEFEDIVWSTADHDDLLRSLDDMYESYKAIARKRGDGRTPIDRKRYTAQIRKLKGPSYGEVMQQEEGRPGWYSYREKMLRGYVRMQAQANGIELTGERPSPKQTMHVGNARSGYRGASVPQGVRIGKDISEWDKE